MRFETEDEHNDEDEAERDIIIMMTTTYCRGERGPVLGSGVV